MDSSARQAVGLLLRVLPPREAAASGIVVGNAYGNLDGCAAYVARFLSRGPRLASPSDFPNLVPSAPAGHASLYFGAKGAAWAVADARATGEAAVLQALELVDAGEVPQVGVVAFEEASDVVDRVLSVLYGRPTRRLAGGASLLVEAAHHARARGASPLAQVLATCAWAGVPVRPPDWPTPTAGARVLRVHAEPEELEALAALGWGAVPHDGTAPSAAHEGVGAVAFARAVLAVASGSSPQILVLGATRGRGTAFVLGAP